MDMMMKQVMVLLGHVAQYEVDMHMICNKTIECDNCETNRDCLLTDNGVCDKLENKCKLDHDCSAEQHCWTCDIDDKPCDCGKCPECEARAETCDVHGDDGCPPRG